MNKDERHEQQKRASALGVVAWKIISKKRALERYYKDPVYCKQCGKMIEPSFTKTGGVRITQMGEFYNKSKGELLKERGYFNFRSLIQGHALLMWKTFGSSNICKVCGYDKHVEVCHIKSVSSFLDTATVLEINSIENLVVLCRNHHWEYDHDLLKL